MDLPDWSSSLATPEATETPQATQTGKVHLFLGYWRSRSAGGSGHDPERHQELRYLPKLLQSKLYVS